MTQNFRANRRRPAKAPNVLKISSTALLGARTQTGTSRGAWSPPWWTRASSSEHLVWHSDRFIWWGNHCLLRYGGHHIKPAFGPGPLSVNQGFLTLEQPDTYHIILSMVLFLGQKKLFPEIFLLLCTLRSWVISWMKWFLADWNEMGWIIVVKNAVYESPLPGFDNSFLYRLWQFLFRLWQFFFQAMTIFFRLKQFFCSGYDNFFVQAKTIFFQAITIFLFRLWQFFSGYNNFFCSGYDNSEMMSLEEEISHLHKENSHVIIMRWYDERRVAEVAWKRKGSSPKSLN